MKQKINMIVAIQNSNSGIGINNNLLYSIKKDMEYFMETTMGSIVIMGRKTWDSIDLRHRPLKGRENFIISRTLSLGSESNNGAHVKRSWQEAVGSASQMFPEKNIFVMGGGEIYKIMLPYCDLLYATEINGEKEADIFFPKYDNWPIEKSGALSKTEKGTEYKFMVYKNPSKIPLL